jgi:cysteine desulfurase
MKTIYLDYAAATPLDPEAYKVMQPYLNENFYNPSATYLAGKSVKKDLENARHIVAATLGARPAEIVFTAGATEANNLAIQGVMKKFPGGDLIVSAVEHESVLTPAKQYKHTVIGVNKDGRIKTEELNKAVTANTVLVSVILVNNELGTTQPIKEISAILQQIRSERSKNNNKLPLYLHVDAAQASCYLDLHVSRLGVDLLSLNGGKTYGPKQSGVLFIKTGVAIDPLIYGGGQESGLRSGTENVAGIIGLANALQKSQSLRTKETERINDVKNIFANKLQKISDKITINNSLKHSVPHILSVTFAGADNERLMMELDELGIMIAVGSACSASSGQPSHVLTAIGLNESAARSTLRFSFGRQTTESDLDKTAQALKKLFS